MFGTGLFAPIYRRFASKRDNPRPLSPDVMRNKPWNNCGAPSEIYLPKGMIGDEERRALYWISRHWFAGRGEIVDAGAYIGASAFAIAAGASANPVVKRRRPIIHSYDYFQAVDDYVIRSLRESGHAVEPGGDYLDVFRGQTRRYRDLIEPHPGDFLTMQWHAPIELLFIDIAKTPELNTHLIREFFPHLIPGHSLVIHQDFFHCWHPHIHITMEALEPYFEIIDGHIDFTSRLYRCTKAIPSAALEEAASFSYTPEERLRMLDAIAVKEIGDMRAMIEVATMWQLVLDGNEAMLEQHHADFLRRYRAVREKAVWWWQAQDVMAERMRRAIASPAPALTN